MELCFLISKSKIAVLPLLCLSTNLENLDSSILLGVSMNMNCV